MNFLAKTYQLLALTVNFIAGGLLLISAYSYLIPPDRFSLPYFSHWRSPYSFLSKYYYFCKSSYGRGSMSSYRLLSYCSRFKQFKIIFPSILKGKTIKQVK